MNMSNFVVHPKYQIGHDFGGWTLGKSFCGSIFIAMCSQISVPLIPIPITMQTLSVFLIASTLGPKIGMRAILLFLAEGALGVPVFANFSSELSVLLGPSGGYLLGFVPAVYSVGALLDSSNNLRWPKVLMAGILGEDSVLEETNTCFNPQEIVESNVTFILGVDALSEHIWNLQPKEILERFDNNIVSYSDVSDKEYYCANPILFRDFVEEIQAEITVVPLNSKALSTTALCETNPYWHEHRHFDKACGDNYYVSEIYFHYVGWVKALAFRRTL
jgi:hypothetical protein